MPRPKLNPTEEQRSLVKQLAASGIPQKNIARKMNIRSVKTLRKYFREELDLGATDANTNVAAAMYQSAISGNVNAQRTWMFCRAGWGRPASNADATVTPIRPPEFIVALDKSPEEDEEEQKEAA
jgi:hypothetical protein